jgi:hypothetical protein
MIARQLKQLHALSLALLGQYLKQTRFGGFLLFGFSTTQNPASRRSSPGGLWRGENVRDWVALNFLGALIESLKSQAKKMLLKCR